jgi:hypothetical protein
MEILDPLRIEKMEHESESPFTRFRHRKEHGNLKEGISASAKPLKRYKVDGIPVTEGIPAGAFGRGTDAFGDPLSPSGRPAYTATPQLIAERAKKFADARRAETEATKSASDAEVAILKNESLMRRAQDPKDVVANMQVQNLNPSDPVDIAMYYNQSANIVKGQLKSIPGTDAWYEEQAANRLTEMMKEFPDVDPELRRKAARSIDDYRVTLTPEEKKKLGKSVSGQKLDFEKWGLDLRRAEGARDATRLRIDTVQKTHALAQSFALSSTPENPISPDDGLKYADTFLKTGKMPEGVSLPADRVAELEFKMKEAQQAKFNDDHMEAQISSPKFKALNDLAMRAPEGPQRDAYVRAMQVEYCKNAQPGSSLGACDYKPGIGYGEAALQVFERMLVDNWKMGTKALAIGEGVLRGTARAVTSPGSIVPDIPGPGMSTAPRGGPIGAPGGADIPEGVGQTLAKEYSDKAQPILMNPSTPMDVKLKIMADAKALKTALETGDWTEVARLMGEIKK